MSSERSITLFVKLLAVTVVMLVLFCGRPHLKLPLEEMHRPLTHPKGVHGIRLGLPPRLLLEKESSYRYEFQGPLVHILPGYVEFREGLELNFPVEIYLKYSPFKNTEIKNDELLATGFNWAVYGGVFFIGVSPGDGPMFKEAIGTTFKHLLSRNVWTEGNGELYLRNITGKKSRNIPSMHLFAGSGVQITKRFASTVGFLMDGIRVSDSTDVEYGIPVRLQWHVNHSFSFSLTSGAGYHNAWGLLFGFDIATYW